MTPYAEEVDNLFEPWDWSLPFTAPIVVQNSFCTSTAPRIRAKSYFHLHRNINSLMPLCRRLRLSGEAPISRGSSVVLSALDRDSLLWSNYSSQALLGNLKTVLGMHALGSSCLTAVVTSLFGIVLKGSKRVFDSLGAIFKQEIRCFHSENCQFVLHQRFFS